MDNRNPKSIPRPTVSKPDLVSEPKNVAEKHMFAFGRKNYLLMFLGLAFLAVGFIIMSLDKEPYGFGFLGLTLGPIVVFIGFLIEFFAIMANDRKNG
jgi:hypothetical protein